MTRSFWGWADERAIDADEREGVKLLLGAELGVASVHELPAPALAAIAPAVTTRGRPRLARSDLFRRGLEALRAAKARLDPKGTMNPGVLLP